MSDAASPGPVVASPPSVPVLAGALVWSVLALLSLGPLEERLGLLEVVFLLGPCVIVPLAFGMLGDLRSGAPGGAEAWIAIAYLSWPFGLVALVVAMLFAPGVLSGILALGWLVPTGFAALAGLFWIGSKRSLRASVLAPSVALIYLFVGADWFVLWRFGLRPFDLSDDIVALTATHFHVAGFGGIVLAWLLVRALRPGTRSSAVASAAAVGAVVGMPITAAGFTFDAPFLSTVGAIVLALSFLAVAAITAGGLRELRLPAGGSVLLMVSSLSVVVGMALAVHYAFGQWTGTSTLSIDRMVQTHGVANGLGFVTFGLLGWSMVRDAVFAFAPPDRPGS
ncbi:MAG: YndJ family transporter [Actinomycetota bacterium]